MGGRGESRGHGCGKLPGSTGRPWSHYEGGVGLDTFTRENYHKIAFVRESRRVHQVAVLKLNTQCTLAKYLWIASVIILKETCMNQDKFNFAQGGKQFYCKKNEIIINYCYSKQFEIPIVGFQRYCNVPRINIVALKTVIMHYIIFSRKDRPLHNDVSTENITTPTEKSIE